MDPLLLHIIYFVIGLVGLYFGAEWLVKGAVDLALIFGVAPLVIGLTVVAFGTSAPEMFVGVSLNNGGSSGAAIGNVVGSNICNIALMLGIAGLIRPIPVHTQIFKKEIPILIGASIVLLVMLRDADIARWEAGILFAGILGYLALSFLKKGKKKLDPEVEAEFQDEVAEISGRDIGENKTRTFIIGILLVIVGIAVLVVAADRLKVGAVYIALKMGVSEAVIGLTLIAIGTSLPEIATSIVAIIKREGDIITGNAIGSCIFNILAVVGVVGLVKPLLSVDGIAMADLFMMFGVLIFALPFMIIRKQLGRIECGILLVGYLIYCWTLLQRGEVPEVALAESLVRFVV